MSAKNFASAICHLKFLSDDGGLGGKLYGRLPNIASVPRSCDLTPVNSALSAVVNLGSCVVVSDRKTAHKVIDFFSANKIGTVTCQILSEIPCAGNPNTRPEGDAVGDHEAYNWVSSLIRVDDGLRGIFDRLLKNWTLVENREKAVALIQGWKTQRGRQNAAINIVTR